jgi:hypothetical protein
MKTITSNCVTRRLLMAFFWILVFSGTVHAQSGTYLIWNNEVGCITYDSEGNPNDPRKKLELSEDVENGPCIRVCEGKTVNYTMNGANIANVQWSAAGGTVTSVGGAANKNATVAWGGPGNGALTLTITYTNGTQTTTTVCIEIINGPKSIFEILGFDEPVFCIDTPINFENLSINNGGSDIVQYQWNFDDGNYSSTFEPTHSFDHAGSFKVTLTVTNNCNCSNSYSLTVNIIDKPNITISCPSVVCENGDKQVYTVDDECGGEWIVEGGHIAAQTPTSVTVVWDAVDASGFGSVSYKSSCACPFWTTAKIPVIKKIGTIIGDAVLCVGQQGLYTLPQWPTTEFVWVLTPTSPTGTHLVFNDQRNQVIVDALAPGNYILKCTYTNTLLGCGGTAEFKIRVVAGTVISGGLDQLCSGTSSTYTTVGGGSVQWELKKNNSVVASTTGINFTYNFPTGGVYTLTATTGGCISEPKVINVTQTPSAPTGPLVGEVKYCPGVPYDYSLTNTVPNTMLEWTVTNGTIQGDNTGNNVTIVFNNTATATITVRRRSLDGMGCLSPAFSVVVNKIVITPTITPNTAGTIFCPSSSTTFNVNLNGNTADLLEWSVVPANFGNVISGVNSNTVVVNWNEISTSPTGTLRLKIRKCGVDTFFDTAITLQQTPNLTLTAPAQLCSTDLNLALTLTAPGVSTGTITWNFGNGVTQTTALSGTSNYTFTNPYNNATANNINYTITATLNLPNGCNYTVNATDTILVFPKTIISITPGYNYIVCPTSYAPFTLTANATTGLGVTVSYQWYKIGVGAISGATASTYTISNATQGTTPGGTYYVSVTDSNTCQVKSQPITVTENCVTVPPCSASIVPAPNLNLIVAWSSCDIITATATYNGTPVSVQWQGSPLLVFNSGNNTTAQFTTDVPGAHLVTVFVTFPLPGGGTCTVQKTVEVIKRYKANFNTTIVCNNGLYNVSLINNSTVSDLSNPIVYTFSGTGLPPTVGQTINLTGLAPGTYNYTLTLSMSGMPNCSINKTIVLKPMPDVNILPVNTGTNYCAEETINLTIPNYDPVNTYVWNFLSTSYVASSAVTPINMNVTTSTQSITLTATNPYGCSFTSAIKLVNITKANLPGTIQPTPSASVCEGTPVTLTFSPSGTTPSSFAWMKGNLQVGTGNSYLPTSSGNYWIKVFDGSGCVFTNNTSINITIKQRPYAGIVGGTNVCSGEQGTLQGIVTNSALERRWLLNGSPMSGTYGVWATTTPLTITVPTAPGIYNYTFEVRPTTDTTCGSSASTSVTVFAPVATPVLTYTVVSCEPYLVNVSASGPSTGNYNWSNGSVGQTIQVTYGGGLGVTYTATSGCTASADIMIPEPTERSLWMFPVGCYDVCLTNPTRYIIGPLGVYDHYEWLVNGFVSGSGNNTNIQNQYVNQAGTYQLSIDNDGCHSETGIMNVAPDLKECEIVPCNFKSDVKDGIIYQNGVYVLNGYIQNTTGSPITVTITSFNNYGTYSPNQVTIAAGATYNFGPLYFTPNPGYTGGQDYIVFQMPGCMNVEEVKFPTIQGDGHRSAATPAVLTLAPNPATEYTLVHYDLGDSYKQAQSLIVFDLLGNELITHKLDKASDDVEVLISHLASGTYIVSIQADGIRAIQQTLVKK